MPRPHVGQGKLPVSLHLQTSPRQFSAVTRRGGITQRNTAIKGWGGSPETVKVKAGSKMVFHVSSSKLLGFPYCSGGRMALPLAAFYLEERINEVFDVKTQMKANMTKLLFKLSLFTNI